MTAENDDERRIRLYNALENIRQLAGDVNETDITTIEGLAYHVQRRIETINSMRNEPGIYLTREEANAALDRKVKRLPYAENPSRNVI